MLFLLFSVLIFGIPLIIQKFKHKIPFSSFFSPIVLCYAAGILLSIINKERVNLFFNVAIYISQFSILVAIPLLLYGSSSIKRLSGYKRLGLSFFFASVSSAISCFTVAWWFQSDHTSFAQIGAMLTGLYIGGTPNMQAIGYALKGDPKLTVQLTAADALIGGSYLVLLTSIVPVLTSYVLPRFKETFTYDEQISIPTPTKMERWDYLILVFFTLGWLSVLLGLLYTFKQIDNTAIILFFITGISIILSFLKFIDKRSASSFKLGEYLLLVFALSLSIQGKWSDITRGSNLLFIITAASMYGSIGIHLILSKLFRIDRDTFLISSTAAIYGPPFVTQIASVIKNKYLLMPGILAGLLGYAIGNYVGLAVYYLLITYPS
ncbi:MAG: DUF819 family protein [Saprospiraceae bacterium]